MLFFLGPENKRYHLFSAGPGTTPAGKTLLVGAASFLQHHKTISDRNKSTPATSNGLFQSSFKVVGASSFLYFFRIKHLYPMGSEQFDPLFGRAFIRDDGVDPFKPADFNKGPFSEFTRIDGEDPLRTAGKHFAL